MPDQFDRRVVAEPLLQLIRECQRLAPCHLGGGAALSGAFLHHRLTGDLDLFCHSHDAWLELRQSLPAVCDELQVDIQMVRDARTFSRYVLNTGGRSLELDVIEDLIPDIEPAGNVVEGILIESFADLRAAKLTCILSRSEPRDLVDLLFLDRAGYPPQNDVEIALRKDAGLDPAVLAWLLTDFPCRPLPRMIEPLTGEELEAFRDDLRERFRRLSIPPA